MENNIESMEKEGNSRKNAGYFKVILIFTAVMAILLVGLNYLFNRLF
ncbi:MAG: hypothetical protein LBL04_07135 [Bacteroidales bacterium]|jgi:preprotein translocase subunit SecE|nr:hypothetical protein [Bacteroidales bacterium]